MMYQRVLKRYRDEQESSSLSTLERSPTTPLSTEFTTENDYDINLQSSDESVASFSQEESDSDDDFRIIDSDHDIDFNYESEKDDLHLTFNDKLRDWALRNKITDQALRELLHLLKIDEVDRKILPKDARTLLKKTNKKIETVSLSGGQYWHYGIDEILEAIKKAKIEIPSFLELSINIDGIPVCKSSGKQFWPILMNIKGVIKRPVAVGIFYGTKKPSNLDFLNDFVNEVNAACNIFIHKFVVDVPAAALIKCTKGHTGYYSCGSCTIKGTQSKHKNKVACFPDLEFDVNRFRF